VQALTEIVGEHGMHKFHGEFERLYYALQRVQDNERRLLHKTRQLNDDIDANVASVSAVMAMTEEEAIANVETKKVHAGA